MMTRRTLVVGGVIGLAAAWTGRWFSPVGEVGKATAAEKAYAVSHPEAEWRQRLTPDQFEVLRESGTERPFTSPLNDEHRRGTFFCAGCDREAFSSTTKFDSHTGWPSFWQPLDGAVAQEDDRSFGMLRSEIHCSRCGGHLGHVFNDGPKPTGLRYCMNGVALTFKPAEA